MKASKVIYNRMPIAQEAPEEFEGLLSFSTRGSDIVPPMREKESDAVTVGVWDLDARVGRLDAVLDALNDAQEVIQFHEVHAPLPAGLVLAPDQFASWSRSRGLRSRKPAGFVSHLLAEVFYRQARDVHKGTGLHYLCGITRYMVGGLDGKSIFWNHFTASKGRLLIASGYQLRGYAAEAGRSYEAAIGFLVVAQTLISMSPKLEYHDEDIGCMFDYNDDRDSIVSGLRKIEICPQSLELIPVKYRDAALAMVTALRNYHPEEPAAQPREPKAKGGIEALRKLAEQMRSQK